jgi:hypothetical protein
MMINESDNLPAVVDDGFEGGSGTDRLIQGTILGCVDGRWSTRDEDMPAGKRLIALATTEALQCWRDGRVFDEVAKVPGEPLPDIDELNAKFPKETWEQGLNGPRPPWVHAWVVYLLDPVDASIYTYINSTNGAQVAVNRLKDRVHWMRQLRESLARCRARQPAGLQAIWQDRAELCDRGVARSRRWQPAAGGRPAADRAQRARQASQRSRQASRAPGQRTGPR